MKKIIAIGHKFYLENPSLLRINWISTMSCNYRCPYCYINITPDKYNNNSSLKYKDSNLTINKVNNLINNIILNYHDKKELDMTISGGEPTEITILFDIVTMLINKIKNLKNLRIHTNFSKDINYWKKIVDIFKNNKTINFSIEASLHLDYINTKEKLYDYLNKLLFLRSNNILVDSWTMINKINKNKAIEYSKIINEKIPNLTKFRLVHDLNTGKPFLNYSEIENIELEKEKNKNTFIIYENNELEFKTQNEILSNSENTYKGMLCLRGINQIKIENSGLVSYSEYDSLCDNYYKERVNFFEENCFLKKCQPTICKRKFCVQPGDMHILKADLDYYKKFIANNYRHIYVNKN
jgi:organic radical activating enzyme